jgi:hypothetical protein
MTAITYNFIKQLEQAGFTPAQVEVLASFPTQIVTKTEFIQTENTIKEEIKMEIKEVTDKIDRAETRLEKRMDERFNLIDQQFTSIREDIQSLRSLVKWSIGLTVALIPSITTWMTWISHLSH